MLPERRSRPQRPIGVAGWRRIGFSCWYLDIKILYVKVACTGGRSYPGAMIQRDDPDLIDMLVSDWRQTRPSSRPEAMQIVGRIIRLGRAYEEQVTRLLRPHGLSYSDFDVLATLRRIGSPHEMSPTRLQRNVLLTSGAMTACLRRLEALGLIERRSAVSDRRRLTAKLTDTGAALVESLIDARFTLADEALGELNSSQNQLLTLALRRLVTRMNGSTTLRESSVDSAD